MKDIQHTIHDNPGGVLDCSCLVEISKDAETIGMYFPALSDPENGVGPMVYVCMVGTEVTLRIGSTEEIEYSFAYSEREQKWKVR